MPMFLWKPALIERQRHYTILDSSIQTRKCKVNIIDEHTKDAKIYFWSFSCRNTITSLSSKAWTSGEEHNSWIKKQALFVLVWVYVAMVIGMTLFYQQNVKAIYRCTVFWNANLDYHISWIKWGKKKKKSSHHNFKMWMASMRCSADVILFSLLLLFSCC